MVTTLPPEGLRTCTVLRGPIGDVSRWPQTSTITRAAYGLDGRIRCEHTKAGQWPTDEDGIEGNVWIVVAVAGRWYAAPFEWLRSGQTTKHVEPVELGTVKIARAPLDDTWPGPREGEMIGLFVSTHARNDHPGLSNQPRERSGIVWLRMGTDQIVGRETDAQPPPDPGPAPTPAPAPGPTPAPAPELGLRDALDALNLRLANLEERVATLASDALVWAIEARLREEMNRLANEGVRQTTEATVAQVIARLDRGVRFRW